MQNPRRYQKMAGISRFERPQVRCIAFTYLCCMRTYNTLVAHKWRARHGVEPNFNAFGLHLTKFSKLSILP